MKKRPLRPFVAVEPVVDGMESARLHRLPVVPHTDGGSTSSSPQNSSNLTTPHPARLLRPARLSFLSTILKPMATQKSLHGSTMGLSNEGRKRRVIRAVPILTQAIRDYYVNEDALIHALQITLYANGEVIFHQGNASRDLYFIEEGRVNLVQKRLAGMNSNEIRAVYQHSPSASLDTEVHIRTFKDGEYFGEVALLQSAPRNCSAIADGKVACMVLPEGAYRTLLEPVHQLLLNRYFLRFHSVLEKVRIFKELTPVQLQYLIDHCLLESFTDGAFLCRQGEIEDRFYVIVEGEAQVFFNESGGGENDVEELEKKEQTIHEIIVAETTKKALGQKELFESFGEMGLLGKPRSATVVSVGSSLCLVITRKTYLEALAIGNSVLDAEAESLLASSLVEEWNLTRNALNLHISNPRVAQYLVTFIKKFKESYNQKFSGKTSYMELFRRIHEDATLISGLDFIVNRIDWESPTSSLSIIRAETQRILHMHPSLRSLDELCFFGRLIETTNFLSKFDVPQRIHRSRVAQSLGRVMSFLTIRQDMYLFRQGKEESKAFVILRGKINIVNEDFATINTSANERSNSVVRRQDILTTLLAGESFGELALITVMKRSASAIVAADADLLVIDRSGLHALMNALPGVSIRHVMAKRAEFLGNLDCFRKCDVAQRIRIAHDMQESVFESRHVFFQDLTQQKDLIFVKSGEISVFVKKSRGSMANADCSIPIKDQFLLIKVATIGSHEFFGTSILSEVVPSSPIKLNSGSPTTAPCTCITSADIALANDTFYVCDSRVQVLALSERGWKRLDVNTLRSMRMMLVERNRWHHHIIVSSHDLACYQVDKPWILVSRGPAKLNTNQGPTHLSSTSYHGSALAAQLKAKEAAKVEDISSLPRIQPGPITSEFVNNPLPVVPIIPSKTTEDRRKYALGGSFFTAMEPNTRKGLVSPLERNINAVYWTGFAARTQRSIRPRLEAGAPPDVFTAMWKAHPPVNS